MTERRLAFFLVSGSLTGVALFSWRSALALLAIMALQAAVATFIDWAGRIWCLRRGEPHTWWWEGM